MATTIGADAFPGGTWVTGSGGHVLSQLCSSAPAGTISVSRAWIRRDSGDPTQPQLRMAIYDATWSTRYGFSDVLTLTDANTSVGSFQQKTFTWSTPASGWSASANLQLILQFDPNGTALTTGATAGGGGGNEFDGYTFASGAPASLTSPTARTVSFPLSADVDPPVVGGGGGQINRLLLGVG